MTAADFDPYLLAKLAHLLGAAVLMGAGAAIAWFQWFAYRADDAAAFRAVAPLVVRADWTFTLTAGLLQPVSGAAMIVLGGWDPLAGWLLAAYGLYGLVFACWAPVVVLQIRARDLARADAPRDALARVMRIWFLLGWPAFTAMLALFWLMIAKPDL